MMYDDSRKKGRISLAEKNLFDEDKIETWKAVLVYLIRMSGLQKCYQIIEADPRNNKDEGNTTEHYRHCEEQRQWRWLWFVYRDRAASIR